MRTRTVKILTGIAIVLVALAVIYAIWVSISAAKLRRAYAALERDGRPMRAADVIPPEVPETENAALLYESAALLLKATPAPWKNAPGSAAMSVKESIDRDRLKDLLGYLGDLSGKFAKESLEADQRAELQNLLQEDAVTHALFAIRQGAERPSCRFDLDYDAGMNMLMPHMADLGNLTRILGAKVRFEAEAGRPGSAWDLALTQLKLANALRTEPTLVSQLVRAACIRVTCRTIQRLCAIAPPDQQQYNSLDEILREFDDTAPLVLAADGERLLLGEHIFTLRRDERRETLTMLADEGHAPEIVRRLIVWRMSFKPLFLADHAAYLRLTREYTHHFTTPFRQGEAEDLDRKLFKTEKHHKLTHIFMPAVGRIKEIHTRLIAEIRITQVGLAMLRHKDTHGALPKTLGDLPLEGLDDPFSEGPLRYQPETNGFVLYSLAADQKDNDGSPREPKQETDYDIVWRFPSQPTR